MVHARHEQILGGDNDTLWNTGWIQAAGDGTKDATTELRGLNEFYNGGMVSMFDGGAGDNIYTSGDYEVGSVMGPGARLGVDTYFGQRTDPDTESDVFTIGGDIVVDPNSKGTGIVIHKTSTEPGGINHRGIDVVEYNGSVDNPCGLTSYSLCEMGNAFYIHPNSQYYIGVPGGSEVGAIADGMFAWYLRQDTAYDDFELVSDFSPLAYQLPSVMTQAQGIWYQTNDVVEDHLRGNHFPDGGSGGADLMADEPGPETDMSSTPSTRGGIWLKGTGNWTQRDTQVNDGLIFDTSYDQDTYGILGGADLKPFGDGLARVGIFGGYVNSTGRFNSWNAKSDFEGWTAGGYLDLSHGGFYADAEVKADFLDMSYAAPIGGGVDGSADATSVGVRGNGGYRMEGARAFIEPIVSAAYVNTTIGDFAAGGAEIDYSNGESLRAGGGARVGTTFGGANGGMGEFSILGKLWNEFESENTVTVTDPLSGTDATFTDGISGLFGEVEGALTVYNARRTWSAFASGGAQFDGDDYLSLNARGGVRLNY